MLQSVKKKLVRAAAALAPRARPACARPPSLCTPSRGGPPSPTLVARALCALRPRALACAGDWRQ